MKTEADTRESKENIPKIKVSQPEEKENLTSFERFKASYLTKTPLIEKSNQFLQAVSTHRRKEEKEKRVFADITSYVVNQTESFTNFLQSSGKPKAFTHIGLQPSPVSSIKAFRPEEHNDSLISITSSQELQALAKQSYQPIHILEPSPQQEERLGTDHLPSVVSFDEKSNIFKGDEKLKEDLDQLSVVSYHNQSVSHTDKAILKAVYSNEKSPCLTSPKGLSDNKLSCLVTPNNGKLPIGVSSPSGVLNNNLFNIFCEQMQIQTEDPTILEKEEDKQDLAKLNLELLRSPLKATGLKMDAWLESIGLKDLTANFSDNGYTEVDRFLKDYAFCDVTFQDLLYRFGIDKIGHRYRIIMKIREGKFQTKFIVK